MTWLTNLGYITDCIFHRQDGFVEQHADFLVIRTPDNPTFWFGNLLVFKKPPLPGDLERWSKIHAEIFGDSLNHTTIGWDESAPGSTTQFTEVGFRLVNDIVLSMSSYAGGIAINPSINVRPLSTEEEWEALLEMQCEVDREYFDYPNDAGEFRRTQVDSARRMTAKGRGDWWGGFIGDKLISGCLLYTSPSPRDRG